MFSLVASLLSVAVVVALLAATMYYGGPAISRSTTTANATGFVSGANQISEALALYEYTELGSVRTLTTAGPNEFSYLNTLTKEKMLATIPMVKTPLTSGVALSPADTWALYSEALITTVGVTQIRGDTLVAPVASTDVCEKLNKDGNPTGNKEGKFHCENNVFTFYITRH